MYSGSVIVFFCVYGLECKSNVHEDASYGSALSTNIKFLSEPPTDLHLLCIAI